MKISNNENSTKAQSSKSRTISRVRPKPLSDLTNIQTTLPKPKPKIGNEPDKENVNPCRPDKFVFFSNLKFIPESEEVASTSGQDNDINNNLVETEDPLWLVKAIEKDKGENDLDASSQSCPVIEIARRSRKTTRSTNIKQRMHGTFPLPDAKTKKRKRQMVSPVKLKEPLRSEMSAVTPSLKAPAEQEESSSSESKTDPKTPVSLPPEFVEQQKAYFSQIDAFELEEESQSSDDG